MTIFSRRSFMAAAAATPLVLRVAPASAAPLPPGAAALIDDFVARQKLGGSVAFGRQGKITSSRVFGLADRERGIAFGPATTVRIGSVSKWLTTVAVLRLAERGLLSIDAPLRAALPELVGPYGDVPLVQLLANSSGIPDRVTQAIGAEPGLRASLAGSREMVARFGSGELAFAPGTRFDYAFNNWVLIHAAIERVTKARFEDVLAREVFRPAGLRQTGFADTRTGPLPGSARAYDNGGKLKEALVPPFGGASGNIVSGAADLVRAAHVIFDTRRLLTPQSRTRLVTVRMADDHYALGGRVRDIAGRQVAWETGKVQGYRTHLAHDLSSGRSVVLLSNSDTSQDDMTALVDRLLPYA